MSVLAADWTAHDNRLMIAALLGIAVIVLLITVVKQHPFLGLVLGSLTLGLVAGMGVKASFDSFTKGLGSIVGSVGVLIALGAMLGRLLADSGGADRVVDTILARATGRWLPWAMGVVAAITGLPVFFEVGVVLLIPVVLLIARRGGQNVIRLGIPALAGLSVLHGLVPPHPGPLVAIDALHADLGRTLLFGLLISVPTVIVAGPLFGQLAARWLDVEPPEQLIPERRDDESLAGRPGLVVTVLTVLSPVILMLGKAVADP